MSKWSHLLSHLAHLFSPGQRTNRQMAKQTNSPIWFCPIWFWCHKPNGRSNGSNFPFAFGGADQTRIWHLPFGLAGQTPTAPVWFGRTNPNGQTAKQTGGVGPVWFGGANPSADQTGAPPPLGLAGQTKYPPNAGLARTSSRSN